jgi:hypothetical protein
VSVVAMDGPSYIGRASLRCRRSSLDESAGDLSHTSASTLCYDDLDSSGRFSSGSSLNSSSNSSARCSVISEEPPSARRRSSSTLADNHPKSSIILEDSESEMISATALINQEVERIMKRRKLFFPEAISKWDIFWVGLLFLFVLSVLPGFYCYFAKVYPQGDSYWKPTGGISFFRDVDKLMTLYTTPHFGITTPLQLPMPNHFVTHVLFGGLASALLVFHFITGRVMRWRLTNGTVKFESAEALHKSAAIWSSIFWVIIIVTGTKAVPLLHPFLQIANYAESCAVSTLFIGTLLSAYSRQWVLHRLCSWGLIYSATASVFLLVNGRLLQALTTVPTYNIKAINYLLAFSIPMVGLLRDILYECSKLNQVEENEAGLYELAEQNHQHLIPMEIEAYSCKPFQAARGYKQRRLSLWRHIMEAEPDAEYATRRSFSAVPSDLSSSDSSVAGFTKSSIQKALDQLQASELLEIYADYDD